VNADTTLPPWLIIVHRDKDTLYHNLRQAFESDPRVTVIKDRRRADRRKETVALQSERRQLDRRLPLTAEGEKIWQSLRFRLIHRDDKLTVYQAGEPPEGPLPAATTEKPRKQRVRARSGAQARKSAGSPRRVRPRRGRR
jgi:hypothetical protein